ncbi:MAG: kelch repeat-containing protein [Crocinitomicaceae bacterium]|nr:kelch repeat-containing protein [Crocinitomicaceae bacterium]
MRIAVLAFFFFMNLNCFAGGWIQKADFGGIARHRTTLLTIGNKVYTGLGHYNGAGPNILFDDWWEYDPSTNSWSQKADYLGGLCYHATGFTMNGVGYVGTGRTSASGSVLVQNFYKYDAVTNTWIEINSFPGIGRRGAVSFVIGDYAYTGSGESTSGTLSSFYRFDPSNETWSQVSSLPIPRTSAVAFSIDNYGYVGTGDLDPGTIDDFWQYDPALDFWTQKSSVSPITRKEAMGFALNGKGYIGTGGNSTTGSLADMWEYEPSNDTWVQIEDFSGTARRYFTATPLNGFVYACLGTNGTNFKDLWLWDQSLSLIERTLDKLEIIAYPNPSTDYLNFEVEWPQEIDQSKIQLEIISLTGQVVFTSPWSQLNTIETSPWNAGHYLCNIIYNDKVVKSEKLIIQ